MCCQTPQYEFYVGKVQLPLVLLPLPRQKKDNLFFFINKYFPCVSVLWSWWSEKLRISKRYKLLANIQKQVPNVCTLQSFQRQNSHISSSSAAFGCFSMRRHRLHSVIHPTSRSSRKSNKTPNEAANTHAPHRFIFPTCSPRLLRMLDSSMPEKRSARALIRALSLCVRASRHYLAILHRTASSSAPAHSIWSKQLLKTYIRTYLIGGGPVSWHVAVSLSLNFRTMCEHVRVWRGEKMWACERERACERVFD